MTSPLNQEFSQPYSELLRRHFVSPAHAGDLPQSPGRTYIARRDESDQGAAVEIAALVADGVITAMRFRAFGCPYLIAAAELLCGHYEGRAVDDLGNLSAKSLLDNLQAPVEKTGRLLLLEDTISALIETVHE